MRSASASVSARPPEHPFRRWLLPSTRLGRLSVGLLAAFFASLLGFRVAQVWSDPAAEHFFDRPLFSALALAAGLSGSAAGVASLVAIVRRRERSPFVFVTLLVGGFVLVFVVGELVGHE